MSDINVTPGIRAIQAVGIIGSAFAAGGIFTCSAISIPAFLTNTKPNTNTTPRPHPHTTATQFTTFYNRGKKTFPPIAAIASVAFGYLAATGTITNSNSNSTSTTGTTGSSDAGFWYYLGASGATLAIVPFTLLGMMGVNRAIMGFAGERRSSSNATGEGVKDEGGSGDDGSVEELNGLLRSWAVLNFARGLGPLVGCVLGFVAVFQ